jgi:hypothetical protein
MTTYTAGSGRPLEDPVSNVLKWVLLAVGLGSQATLIIPFQCKILVR